MVTQQWRKSSASGGDAYCVEVRQHQGAIQMRDSKDPSGPVLSFAPADWQRMVTLVRQGLV